MAEPLLRVTYPDPLCECGESLACHLVPDRKDAPRGRCTYMDATRTCRCVKFRAAAEVPAGER